MLVNCDDRSATFDCRRRGTFLNGPPGKQEEKKGQESPENKNETIFLVKTIFVKLR